MWVQWVVLWLVPHPIVRSGLTFSLVWQRFSLPLSLPFLLGTFPGLALGSLISQVFFGGLWFGCFEACRWQVWVLLCWDYAQVRRQQLLLPPWVVLGGGAVGGPSLVSGSDYFQFDGGWPPYHPPDGLLVGGRGVWLEHFEHKDQKEQFEHYEPVLNSEPCPYRPILCPHHQQVSIQVVAGDLPFHLEHMERKERTELFGPLEPFLC